ATHVDQPVTPVALVAGKMEDAGADDRQVRGHVAGDRIGEAAADEEDLAARVGEKLYDGVRLAVRKMAEGLVKAVDRGRQHRRFVAFAVAAGRANQGRLKLRGKLFLQCRLEFRVVLEAKPRHE